MENNNTYPIIDEYIKSLYKGDKSKEVKELKEELKEHLILSADEFRSKGYDAEKSAKMAIEKFDGGSDMLKELYSSLKVHKSILKSITRVVGLIAIACCAVVIGLVYYTESTDKKEMELSNKIDKELELFTKQNDMTTIDNLEESVQGLLDKELFKKTMDMEIRVADMEDGNTKLDANKNQFKLIYDGMDEKSLFKDRENQNFRGHGGQSFLDKKGNVAHYQYYLESYNIDKVFGMIYSFFWASVIAIVSFLLLKFKLLIDKKRKFS